MGDAQVLHQAFELRAQGERRIRGEVRVRRDGGRRPVLIMLHGFKGFKDWGFFPYAAESMAKRGYYVVTFNFSHNGVKETDFDELDKFGRNTYTLEQADIADVLNAATANRTAASESGDGLPLLDLADSGTILLLGHSRGGGNGLLFAAEHEEIVGAVAAWNGIANCNLFNEAFRERVLKDGVGYVTNARTKQEMPIRASFFRDLDDNRERFDIPAKTSGLRIPALFLQGDRDSEFLLSGFRRLRETAPQHRYVMLEGTGHTWDAVHPFADTTEALERAIRLTDAFFREAVPGIGEMPDAGTAGSGNGATGRQP